MWDIHILGSLVQGVLLCWPELRGVCTSVEREKEFASEPANHFFFFVVCCKCFVMGAFHGKMERQLSLPPALTIEFCFLLPLSIFFFSVGKGSFGCAVCCRYCFPFVLLRKNILVSYMS